MSVYYLYISQYEGDKIFLIKSFSYESPTANRIYSFYVKSSHHIRISRLDTGTQGHTNMNKTMTKYVWNNQNIKKKSITKTIFVFFTHTLIAAENLSIRSDRCVVQDPR